MPSQHALPSGHHVDYAALDESWFDANDIGRGLANLRIRP